MPRRQERTAKSRTSRTAAARRPPASAKGYYVFLSHGSADKYMATKICNDLRAAGVGCWLDDRDIHGGDEFVEAIINGINDSSEVFVLMTPESVDRPWVQREIGMALGSRKRLVVIHQHISPKKLGASVESLQYADVNEVPKLVELAKHRAARSRKS